MGSLPGKAQLTFTSNVSASSNNCHIDDWTALKALYESTDGDNWKNNDGWEAVQSFYPSRNCDLNDLYGIETNSKGRVIEVALVNNNLRGNLTDELGLLYYLDILRLADNHLSGSIPNSLANLNHLRVLILVLNNLTGTIPNFQNISQLLMIQDNRFTCEEINASKASINPNTTFLYSSQQFAHDYEPIVADIIQTNSVNISIDITDYTLNRRRVAQDAGDVDINDSSLDYYWKKMAIITLIVQLLILIMLPL